MELRHLRYFVAVAEEQNITRAAHRLHVSQPPLSRQVRDLEQELGVFLLERGAKSVRLTAAGRLFLDEARAVLHRADEAVRSVQALAGRRRRELHVGFAPTPTVELMPRILRAFEKAAPDVRVQLHDLTPAEMLGGLSDGTLGAALAVREPRARFAGLEFHLLQTYRMGALMARGNRLCRRRKLSVEAVRREPLVVYRRCDYPDYHRALEQMLGTGPESWNVVEECDGALSLVSAVEAGRGIAVVPETAAIVAGQRALFIPFTPEPGRLEVGVCTRMNPTPDARRFSEIARAASAD